MTAGLGLSEGGEGPVGAAGTAAAAVSSRSAVVSI